jgi:hypothetical protein
VKSEADKNKPSQERKFSKVAAAAAKSNYGYSAEWKHLSGITRYPRLWIFLITIIH